MELTSELSIFFSLFYLVKIFLWGVFWEIKKKKNGKNILGSEWWGNISRGQSLSLFDVTGLTSKTPNVLGVLRRRGQENKAMRKICEGWQGKPSWIRTTKQSLVYQHWQKLKEGSLQIKKKKRWTFQVFYVVSFLRHWFIFLNSQLLWNITKMKRFELKQVHCVTFMECYAATICNEVHLGILFKT